MKRKIFYLIFLVILLFGGAVFFIWSRGGKRDEKGQKLLELQEIQKEDEIEGNKREPEEETQAEVKVEFETPGTEKILAAPPQAFQTFNNCGPATLSMILGYWGISESQKEIADYLRPVQHPQGKDDDKTVFPSEFAEYAKRVGLESRLGVAGTTDLIETFLANDIPIVVKQWLRPDEDIGHFRIVRGYNRPKEIFITSDSYFGRGSISYSKFMRLWQPFNYGYILVFPKDKVSVVDTIIARTVGTREEMYQKARERSELEIKADPENVYPYFNLGTSLYHLKKFEEAKGAFEKADTIGFPRRMLWYQIEPILTYNALGEYAQVFSWTKRVFASGNPAFSELYYERGKAYLAMDKKENAKKEFELAVTYNPNFAPAKETLEGL